MSRAKKPRKSRKSVSVKGLTYFRLRKWCRERNRAVASTVEGWIMERLRQAKPKTVEMFQVTYGDQTIYVLARNLDQAMKQASRNLGELPSSLSIVSIPFQRDRVSFAHLGILTPAEFQQFSS